MPALGKAKQKTQGIYCMNNTRQLTIAWVMYAQDANDRLVGNTHGGTAQNAATVLESIPPLRKTPTGTSAIIR